MWPKIINFGRPTSRIHDHEVQLLQKNRATLCVSQKMFLHTKMYRLYHRQINSRFLNNKLLPSLTRRRKRPVGVSPRRSVIEKLENMETLHGEKKLMIFSPALRFELFESIEQSAQPYPQRRIAASLRRRITKSIS